MRRPAKALLAVTALTTLLAMPATAHAADATGRIDHVENRGDSTSVLYSLPGLPKGVSPDPSTVEVTVDGKPVEAKARTASGSTDSVRRTAVLAIDASDSMNGSKFAAAKEAALAYVHRAPADVYIGLVSFATGVDTVQTPTRDKDRLSTVIKHLTLSNQTHLYDGVLQALDVSGDTGLRSILLLSDGKDTTTTPLTTVIREASNSHVRIDAVALGQSSKEASSLQKIAEATTGTVTATSNLAKLKSLFTDEANDLATQLVVTFPTPTGTSESGTLSISVEAGGRVLSDDAFVALKSAPAESGKPTYEASSGSGTSVSKPFLIGGVGLLFLGLAVLLGFGVTRIGTAEVTPMQQQLSLYTVHGMKRTEKRTRSDQGALQLKESAVAIAGKLMERRDFEASLSHKLDRGGLSLKAAEWLLLHTGIALAAGVLGLLLTGGNIVFMLLAFIAGIVLPWVYLSIRESRRIKAFNSGLAQTLQIIAGALQAGLSLPQAVDTVVQEGGEPVASEFRRAIIEQRLGVEIEDALESVADRMGSVDFKWVVMAVRIQREVGGNLAELLLNVAATIREREYLRRQVAVLSAEGRLSAFILGGLPPFFVAYLALARPTYLAPMLHSPMGWGMMGLAVVLMTVGVIWLKQAVKVVV